MSAQDLTSQSTKTLTDFSGLTSEQIQAHWRRNFSGRIPDHLPKSLMVANSAYRLQVDQHGGLSKKAEAYLKAIEADLKADRPIETPYPHSNQLKIGTQLAREHGGVLHRVMVVNGGFVWSGLQFSSLSAVAKAITGTSWNGHKFFGLQRKTQLASDLSPQP